MIAIMPQMRLLVAVEPVDFRKGIDGLVAVCRQRLQADPMSGAVFVFGSRNRRSIKILVYDGQGFLLCQKRLSEGRFTWWPRGGGKRKPARAAPSAADAALERAPDARENGVDVARAGRGEFAPDDGLKESFTRAYVPFFPLVVSGRAARVYL